MKHLLLTTIAAVLLVGCGESQQSAPTSAEVKPAEPVAKVPSQPSPPPAESKPAEPVAEASQPEPPAAEAPDISIHKAAGKGNIEAVKQHLAAGADVNAKLDRGYTALQFAAGRGHKEIAELLIAEGADVNAKDDDGDTPLDQAILDKQTETADLLRKHGGKTGDWLKVGDSIHIAAKVGHIEAVRQHLAAGTDVNTAGGRWRRVPLHEAAREGRKEIAALLIAAGADVNAQTNSGRTPLHDAANGGHKEIAELLIAKGADVNAKSEDGETPLDWANGETADLLRKHGGKTGEELKAAAN